VCSGRTRRSAWAQRLYGRLGFVKYLPGDGSVDVDRDVHLYMTYVPGVETKG